MVGENTYDCKHYIVTRIGVSNNEVIAVSNIKTYEILGGHHEDTHISQHLILLLFT